MDATTRHLLRPGAVLFGAHMPSRLDARAVTACEAHWSSQRKSTRTLTVGAGIESSFLSCIGDM